MDGLASTQQTSYEDDATQEDSERTASEEEGKPWGILLASGEHSENGLDDDHTLSQGIVTLGRRVDCDIRLNDPVISTRHCSLVRRNSTKGFRVYLQDNSSNGTFVDGKKVGKESEVELENGTEVVLKKKHMGKERISYIYQEWVNGEQPDRTELDRKYRVGDVLGQGSFAKVYKGERRGTEKQVAIKVIDKNKVQLIQSTRNCDLMDEVDIMKNVQHDNVIRVLDVVDTPSKLYIVLEFADRGELFDHIVKKGAYQESEAREVFKQIVGAIGYLHDKGIAHRDLKPENILVATNDTGKRFNGTAPKDVMKITDFGLSRMVGPTSFMSTMCGTPQYLAPEVVTAKTLDNGYGVQVDMWSLGVILYVLNSGRMPFSNPSQIPPEKPPILKQIQEGLVDFDPSAWSDRSRGVVNLVQRLLTVQPDLRATAAEVMGHSWMLGSNEPTKDEQDQVAHAKQSLADLLAKKRGKKRARESNSPSPAEEPKKATRRSPLRGTASPSLIGVVHASPSVSPRKTDGASSENNNAKEMCKYGSGCYRRDPAHFERFAHPEGHRGAN